MPVYTRTGDNGQTGLFGGKRLSKSALRIAAIGDVDELNACLGLCRAANPQSQADATLSKLQDLLFVAGADLATPMEAASKIARIGLEETQWLEKQADKADKTLPPLTKFILPGGSPQAVHLHHARTVCRRAERSTVALAEQEVANPKLIPFLNRLSSLLFVLARQANAQAGVKETEWRP